jgi:hypothetical protein
VIALPIQIDVGAILVIALPIQIDVGAILVIAQGEYQIRPY